MEVGPFLREAGLGYRPRPPVPAINREAWLKLVGPLASFQRLAVTTDEALSGLTAPPRSLLVEIRNLIIALRQDLLGLSDDRENYQ